MIRLILSLLLLTVALDCNAQSKRHKNRLKTSTQQKDCSERFRVDTLQGVYIPYDLDDCFKQIDNLYHDTTRSKIKNMSIDDYTTQSHLNFGMWMRNNWQLWGGSRLSKFFNDKQIYHPDDMSGIILRSYHRYLNQQDIKLNEQFQHCQGHWEQSKKARLERQQKEFDEYKVGDTVLYKYRSGYSSKKQEKLYDADKCIAKGKIIERNVDELTLKVQIIESCGNSGLVYYDNDTHLIYNSRSCNWEKPKKRIIKKVKDGNSLWYEYLDWEYE